MNKRILVIMIILVTSISFIGCTKKAEAPQKVEQTVKITGNNSTANNTNITPVEEVKFLPVNLINTNVKNLEFSNLQYRNKGVCNVEGNVKNLNNKKLNALVTVVFYDKNNKEIGTATGAIPEIEANQTQKLLANSTEEIKDVNSIKIEINILNN